MIYVPLRPEMFVRVKKDDVSICMFSLNSFTKQTMQGDVQCISCS